MARFERPGDENGATSRGEFIIKLRGCFFCPWGRSWAWTNYLLVGGPVYPPLWKIWVNWDDNRNPNIWENKIDVPNHQPVFNKLKDFGEWSSTEWNHLVSITMESHQKLSECDRKKKKKWVNYWERCPILQLDPTTLQVYTRYSPQQNYDNIMMLWIISEYWRLILERSHNINLFKRRKYGRQGRPGRLDHLGVDGKGGHRNHLIQRRIQIGQHLAQDGTKHFV